MTVKGLMKKLKKNYLKKENRANRRDFFYSNAQREKQRTETGRGVVS